MGLVSQPTTVPSCVWASRVCILPHHPCFICFLFRSFFVFPSVLFAFPLVHLPFHFLLLWSNFLFVCCMSAFALCLPLFSPTLLAKASILSVLVLP